MKKSIPLLFAAVLAISTSAAQAQGAQEDHAYTLGPVTIASYIRTEPGKFEDYLHYLAGTYKKLLEEAKKQGTITDYAVYETMPRTPEDPDLILTVTYKNMAAFDDLQTRMDPLVKQLFGSLPKAATASADRGKLRKELGSRMIRQLILK
jgi:hypothetical protein